MKNIPKPPKDDMNSAKGIVLAIILAVIFYTGVIFAGLAYFGVAT